MRKSSGPRRKREEEGESLLGGSKTTCVQASGSFAVSGSKGKQDIVSAVVGNVLVIEKSIRLAFSMRLSRKHMVLVAGGPASAAEDHDLKHES